MMVLAISGSPRRGGNTEVLVGEALIPFKERGWEVRVKCLGVPGVLPCTGCDSCKGLGDCRINDGMTGIYGDMMDCHAVIMGSPVYYRNVTAQLKAVIDRTYAIRTLAPLKGKACGAIAVGRGSGGGQAIVLTAIYNYFLSSGGICVPGELNGVSAMADKPGDVASQPDRMRQARVLGENVCGLAEAMVKTPS